MRSAKELQNELVKHRRQGRSRYPAALKLEVGRWVLAQRKAGMSQSATVEALGSPWVTLGRWADDAKSSVAVGALPVQVQDKSFESVNNGPRAVLVTPSGYRVEGLTAHSLVEVLRALEC